MFVVLYNNNNFASMIMYVDTCTSEYVFVVHLYFHEWCALCVYVCMCVGIGVGGFLSIFVCVWESVCLFIGLCIDIIIFLCMDFSKHAMLCLYYKCMHMYSSTAIILILIP